ncbi:MAG: tetratricopeptide repeat protein [Myxococcota bacterium]
MKRLGGIRGATAGVLSTLVCLGVGACGGGSASQAVIVEASPQEPPSRPLASAKVAEGEQLLAKGAVKEAWALFEEALAEDPNDPRAWLDLGLVHEEVGDWSAAERAYRRATEIDGRFTEAFNNLGVLLRERQNLPDAITMLEHAVALDPNFGPARFNLALAYEDTGNLEGAEREYLAAIEQASDDPVPRINLAMLYLRTNRTEDALVQLRAAEPSVQGDVLLSIAVGSALRRAGAPEDAVRVLHGALAYASDPPPTELLAELALALYASDDHKAAQSTMRRAVDQRPNDPALQYALGTMLASQGQHDEAKPYLKRTIQLAPNGPLAPRARAQLQAQ